MSFAIKCSTGNNTCADLGVTGLIKDSGETLEQQQRMQQEVQGL